MVGGAYAVNRAPASNVPITVWKTSSDVMIFKNIFANILVEKNGETIGVFSLKLLLVKKIIITLVFKKTPILGKLAK
jgi:hypothetical protein